MYSISALPISFLLVAFSSWFVPPVIASSDHDESTVSETAASVGDDVMAEKENVAEEESQDDDEYNPVGLQIWPDESSLVRAVSEGGRLLLVIILAPWCNRGDMNLGIQKEASFAAQGLEKTFSSLPYTFPTVKKPLIGIMDSTATGELIESFGSVTHYPAFKFVLTTSIGKQKGGDGDDDDVHLWDFVAPRETAKDLHDSVMMYWYRFVLSSALRSPFEPNGDGKATSPVFTFSSRHGLTTFLKSHGDRLFRPAQARFRQQTTLESQLFNFYMGEMDNGSICGGVFHHVEFMDEDGAMSSSECNAPDGGGDGDGANMRGCDEDEDFIQEVDPYILLVQCRSKIFDYGEVDITKLGRPNGRLTEDEFRNLKMQRSARKNFDDLAEEMAHRRDVAFFALDATTYDEETNLRRKICDGLFDGVEGNANGSVAFFRARRYLTYSLNPPVDDSLHGQNHIKWDRHRRRFVIQVKTDWDDLEQLQTQALFIPSVKEEVSEKQKEMFGKGAVKNISVTNEYVQSNLVASTVVHTTPTVIWFDRDRMAQLAFPWYRKIHAVLFVDMALVHKSLRPNSSHSPRSIWPSSLNHSLETAQLLVTQRRAIQMFYNAALRHRVERPHDDVVFLIVPSSEVRIMTAFGVDIWTPLDEMIFGTVQEDQNNDDEEVDQSESAGEGYCLNSDSRESRDILPVVMITDSSGRSGMQSSRYYLCSNDIFSSSRVKFDNGGAVGEFIDRFFTGTIGKPFVRSETPLPSKPTTSAQRTNEQEMNKQNVTVLTGNTFEPLVMDSREHTMLLMQSATCGHCKRFSIFWNELASIVKAMNWGSVVDVMKIDVSKNDVPHDKINAWDLPSVYYFPAGEKENPIEMTPVKMEKGNPQYDYDEGLSWVTSGYDLVKWMVNQGKLDLELLLKMDGSLESDDTSDEKNEETSDE